MPTTERIRVMLADDHPIRRGGLRDAQESERAFEVVELAADGVVRLGLKHELGVAVPAPVRVTGQIVRPLLHECATPLEQVGPGVGLLCGIAQAVGKGSLRDDPGGIRLLQRPVLEAAAEPVDGGMLRQADGTEDLGQRHVGHRSPLFER